MKKFNLGLGTDRNTLIIFLSVLFTSIAITGYTVYRHIDTLPTNTEMVKREEAKKRRGNEYYKSVERKQMDKMLNSKNEE